MRRSLGRLLAAGIAVAIGTAFVAATLLAGGVITRTSYDAVTAGLAHADLVVRGSDAASQVAEIRAVPGVAAADPLVSGSVLVADGARRVVQTIVPNASAPSLSTLDVSPGAVPAADDEIALPASTLERLDVTVGDTVELSWTDWDDDGSSTQRTQDVRVVGVAVDPAGAWTQYGGAALATPSAVAGWSDVDDLGDIGYGVVVATTGDVATVQSAVQAAVQGDATVMSRDDAARAQIDEISSDGNILVGVVLGFAAVALLVAALVIANTFQVLVAQRTRTLALLRCVGAVRGQLRRSVLLEAGILGLGASLIGLLTGAALAQGALVVLGRMDLDAPLPGTVTVTAPVVLWPLLVGVAVTVLASLVPARAATQVSPIAALRPTEAPSAASRAGRVRLAFSLLLAVGGGVALALVAAAALSGKVDVMLALATGVLFGAVSFVGVLVGAVFWVPKVVALVGRLLARANATARLAAANTVRNPRRTAATSTALLIGVTLVAMMSTGAATARSSLGHELTSRYPVDVQVATMTGDTGTDVAATLATVEQVDGVALAVEVPHATVAVSDSATDASVQSWYEAYAVTDDVRAVVRDDAVLEPVADGTIVLPHRAEPGLEQVVVRTVDPTTGETSGDPVTLATAVVERQGTNAYLTPTTFGTLAPGASADTIWVRISDDADAAAVTSDIRDSLADVPVVITSPSADRAQAERIIDTLLAIVVGLLAVAVLIALIGVANTLSLSVIERRRESATLRAIGLSRRSLRRMLAIEGLLIAGVGAVFGAGLGLLYGWAGAAVVFGGMGELRLTVPWADLTLVLGVALVAGLLASVLPGRAAARTSPVAALAVD
ncbi:ABC transporter permease [Cellulomonas composti]|nr:FtsX-like permease family protein [Cellulomonas composti]